MAKAIGFYKEGGKTRPVTPRTGRRIRMSKQDMFKPVSYQEAKDIHERRSAHARRIDEALTAKEVYPAGSAKAGKWADTPNRSDITGIDTEPNLPKEYKHPFMIWGDSLPPNVKTIPLSLPPKIPEGNFTEYTEVDATSFVSEARKHLNERMYVYGGGGSGGHLVKLKDIDAVPVKYYYDNSRGPLPKDAINVRVDPKYRQTTYSVPNRFNIIAKLDGLGSKDHLFTEVKRGAYEDKQGKYHPPTFKARAFEPHLGSWKLALIGGGDS